MFDKHLNKNYATRNPTSIPFFLRGKIISEIVCLILQITLIGWFPDAIWAVMSLNNVRTNKRNEMLNNSINKNR
jgi:hypothetical protein